MKESAQCQSRKETNISIPTYILASGRLWEGGLLEAVGVRFKSHELAIQVPNPFFLQRGYAFGSHYRCYFPKAGKPVEPFVEIDAGISKIPLIGIGVGTQFGGKSKGLYFGLGADILFSKQLSGFSMLGYGYSKLTFDLPQNPYMEAFAPQLSFGLKYDIPLKGERNQENTLPEDYSSRPRVFFSYKWKFQPRDPANDLYLGFGAPNHQFTLEVRLLRWMRVYGGLQFGGLQNQSDTLGFGFQGGGLGLKLHLYQWKRLAFFNEIGYFYLRRPEYNFYSSRFLLGNSLEYRVRPGFYLFGGQVMGIVNNYFIHEFQVGVTVSPGEIFR
jgi:hypothetical protein